VPGGQNADITLVPKLNKHLLATVLSTAGFGHKIVPGVPPPVDMQLPVPSSGALLGQALAVVMQSLGAAPVVPLGQTKAGLPQAPLTSGGWPLSHSGL
jgi:hypothetical protein